VMRRCKGRRRGVSELISLRRVREESRFDDDNQRCQVSPRVVVVTA
jgi:hypothetical protein